VKIRLFIMVVLVALMAVFGGCESASTDDLTAPSGGQVFVLDQATFVATVAPVMASEGCDNIACHGGGLRGSFELSPAGTKDLDFDFAQAILQVNPNDREASNLLQKPLSPDDGGAVHTATPEQSGFLTKSDPGYQAWLAWIEEGELR